MHQEFPDAASTPGLIDNETGQAPVRAVELEGLAQAGTDYSDHFARDFRHQRDVLGSRAQLSQTFGHRRWLDRVSELGDERHNGSRIGRHSSGPHGWTPLKVLKFYVIIRLPKP